MGIENILYSFSNWGPLGSKVERTLGDVGKASNYFFGSNEDVKKDIMEAIHIGFKDEN